MISIILVAFAAMCNAVMDILSHHYPRSVFGYLQLNHHWWNPKKSWMNKYVNWPIDKRRRKIPVQITDAWHFFKSLMIIGLVCAIVYFPDSYPICFFQEQLYNQLCWIGILGITWNITFSLFYNKILRTE